MISLYDQVVATTGLGDRIRQGTTAALGGDNSSHFEPQVELNITSSTSECGNKNFNQVKVKLSHFDMHLIDCQMVSTLEHFRPT